MKKIAFIIVLVVFLGCNNNHHIALNDKFGFDTAWDAGSKTLKISGFNEPFALFFFSTMCSECAAQIPIINEIAKNTKIIGIMDDSMGFDKDIDILANKGVEFISTSNPKSVKFFQNIVGGISGTPTTVIFDKNGKKIWQFSGLFSKDEFFRHLESVQ